MAKSKAKQFSFEKINRVVIYATIAIISSLMFFPFLGGVHLFDWDEINFAEAAREMLISKNFLSVQIDFRPFLQKPPLFIWLQAISMHLFGINEFAARFPNAFLGVFQLMTLYHIGKKWHGENFGVLWVILYGSSILPFFYFKSAIIDPWFNFFIFLSFYFFIEYFRLNVQKIFSILLSGFFMGLAILTKGPVAFLIFMLVVSILWFFDKEHIKFCWKHVLYYFLSLSFVGATWFIIQILNGNYQMVIDFILYQIRLFSTQDAGHGGFFFYHFVVLFFGVFPASIFALNGLTPRIFRSNKSLIYRTMFILFWVVLILFTIVKTKIVHYSSLAYFPITYLAVLSIEYQRKKKLRISISQSVLLLIVGVFILILLIAIQYIGLHANELAQNVAIKDAFARGNLEAIVHWSSYEFILGLLPLIGILIALFVKRINIRLQIYFISFFTLIFIFLSQLVLLPRIEQYSQNAAIEFFIEHADSDVELETIGYKSYAQYFYGKRRLENQENESRKEYLDKVLLNDYEKTVYAISKVNRWPKLEEKYPKFRKMYTKNGFVFLIKKAQK